MLDKSGVIARLLLADARAKAEVEAVRGLGARPAPEGLAEHVRLYVLHKYLLDDEMPQTHDLAELSQLSVAKAGKLNAAETELLDVSKHCGATSSAMTKKVMLLMSVQRDFCVDLTAVDTAEIQTTDQLAEAIRGLMGRP